MKFIKQSEVNKPLLHKFPEEDIQKASSICKARAEQTQMFMQIACRQDCHRCVHQPNQSFCNPSGSIQADNMFVFLQPDEEDAVVHSIGFGPSSRLLTMMLEKLNIKEQDAYFTSLSKCQGENPEESSSECLSLFFLSELKRVRPKRLILFGEITSRLVLEALGFEEERFEDIVGVKMACAYEGEKLEVISLKSPQDMVFKNGTLFKALRKDLWQGLKRHLNEAS